MGGSLPDNGHNPPEIPPNQLWRHEKHELLTNLQYKVKQKFVIIVESPKKYLRKTIYRYETCQLNFCFNERRNDFVKWHSAQCDHFRMFTY